VPLFVAADDASSTSSDDSLTIGDVTLTTTTDDSTSTDPGDSLTVDNITVTTDPTTSDNTDTLSVGIVTVTNGGGLYGSVWNDVNNIGSSNASDTPLSGWTVILTDTSDPQAVASTTVTDGSGVYRFNNLVDGTYTVCESIPTATPVWQETNTADNVPCANGTFGYSVVISDGDLELASEDFFNTQEVDTLSVDTVVTTDASTTPPAATTTTTSDDTSDTVTGGGNGPIIGSIGGAPSGNLSGQSIDSSSSTSTSQTGTSTNPVPKFAPVVATIGDTNISGSDHDHGNGSAQSDTLDGIDDTGTTTTPVATTTASSTSQTASVIYSTSWSNWYYLFIALILMVLGGVYYETKKR
jgi:hypothetical protein